MRPVSVRLRSFSRAAATMPVLLGLTVALGWILGVRWMQSGVPGYPPMMPNTALGLMLAGVGARMAQGMPGRPRARWPAILGLLVLAIGAITLVELVTGTDTGANHILFHDATASLVTPVDSRPPPRTALCLVLIGCALTAGRAAGRRAGAIAEACTLATIFISLPVLVEYAYAAIPEPVPVAVRGMSLPTAIATCLLAASLLASHPSRPIAALALGGYEGSRRMRQLSPALALAPIALGAVGILIDPGGSNRHGSAGLASSMVAALTALSAWDGRRLNRLDARHRRALRRLLRARRDLEDRVSERTAALSETVESLRAAEERTRSILENLADGVVIVDDEGTILSANPAAQRIFGHGEDRLLGRSIGMLMAEPDRSRHVGYLARFRPEGDSPVVGSVRETTGLRGDGTVFPMELSVGTFALRGRRFFSGAIRDLTLRQKAEEELRRRLELQERLAMVAETVPGLICSFRMRPDGSTSMPFATRAAEDLYGIPAEVLADDFAPVLANVHPDDLEPLRRGVEDAFHVAGPWSGRFRYNHPTKGLRWLEGRSNPRREPDGSVLWHGYVSDVTDRQRDEEARRESERLARSVLDSLPDQVAVVAEGGEILAVNRAWRDFAGSNGAGEVAESANYLAACDGCSGEDRPIAEEFARGIRDVLAGVAGGFEAEYPCHSPGRRRWFLGRVTPFSGPGPGRAVVSHQEVTRLKLAEERLREGEMRFRTLADGINQFAWMADVEGGIYWFNRRWYEYTGAEPDAVLGRGWRDFVHPDHLGRVISSATRSQSMGAQWEDTYPIRSRSGEYRWFLSRAMPVRGPGGEFAGWFGTNTDITERKELEARLTEDDRRKDQFLAMLGHELRNPLATIAVAAEVFDPGGDEVGAPHWARDAIRAQVRHLSRLLDDLLDVARITRGTIRIARRAVDACEVVESVAGAMRPLIEARGQRLDVTTAGGPLGLDADPDRLEQILGNLLANAAKYTPAGGRIRVEAGREGEDVFIRVADTGAGIDPRDLPRLFEPFAQGARTLDRSEGGLGVGLTIAAELARLHGGRIEASSAGPGQGSEFLVILPAAAPSEAPPATPIPVDDDGGPARVLIVDDNRELARGLGQLIQAYGHEVSLAFDGPSGIEAAQSARPDVVLLDLGLPILDGYEVARRLRADPGTARLPIVAISGYAQEDDRRRSAEAGIDEHLAKPVEILSLDRLIRRLARGRDSHAR